VTPGSGAQFFHARLSAVLDLLQSLSGGRLLDVGCGPGILLSQLSGTRFELHGVDQSPTMIAAAKEVVLAHPDNLVVGWAQNLPFTDNYFDVVLALGVLEYVPCVEDALAELYRVAKPGSLIVVSMLNKRSFRWLCDQTVCRVWHAFRRRWKHPVPGLDSLLRSPQKKAHLYLHSERFLQRLMESCQLRAGKTIFYNLNVLPSPLDAAYPQRACAINRWFEFSLGLKLASFTHTGFLIVARK
jgi:ubiquinone/menaquinone biosynthesis C-methylase UbiE